MLGSRRDLGFGGWRCRAVSLRRGSFGISPPRVGGVRLRKNKNERGCVRERERDAYVYELPELKIAEIIGGESD